MKLVKTLVIAMLLAAVAASSAFAKTQQKQISLRDDVRVNGMLVKAGSYKVVFDDATSELAFFKDGKVVAKTTVTVEARTRKAREVEIRSRGEGDGVELLGLTFGGSKENLVVSNGGMQAGRMN